MVLRGLCKGEELLTTDVVEQYFSTRVGHSGMAAARKQYEAWLAIAEAAQWKQRADVKNSHPKAGILKSGGVVFNIKANDFRLVSAVDYRAGLVLIRFFGSHTGYDQIDA